ncbi:19498_t:CDS:2, partial [Racocetra persica]
TTILQRLEMRKYIPNQNFHFLIGMMKSQDIHHFVDEPLFLRLARRDQKTDYEQFRKAHASLHDDIRALQQEIEKFEAACMSSGWNSTKDRDVRQSETTSTVTGSLMAAAVFNGPGRTLASQSATAAARGQRQRNKTRHNRAESFSGGKPTRCIGAEDGWSQDKVHQNEWIRC